MEGLGSLMMVQDSGSRVYVWELWVQIFGSGRSLYKGFWVSGIGFIGFRV